MTLAPAKACAVILAGGAGTRLRGLYAGIPKSMIPVAGYPFLEWVIRYLAGQGLRSFVISLGHLSYVAERYLAERPPDGLAIRSVVEREPLGTGGAVRLAQRSTPAVAPLLVANGDSLVLADLGGVWTLLEQPRIDGVVVGVRVEDTSRYGALEVDGSGRLRGFYEKRSGRGMVNAGIYLFRRRLISRFPEGKPLSLEQEVLPALLERGARLMAYPCDAPFLDIGTPETVGLAEDFIRSHMAAALSKLRR